MKTESRKRWMANEVIKSIESDLKNNPPITWKDEKCAVEFMLRAFKNMRRLAIDLGFDLGGTETFEEAEKIIDEQFEELMDE